MPVVPTALSLLVSYLSGILLLGISSEMYMKGTHMVWYLLGILIAIPMAAIVYQPIFYKLKLTSAYEYLELRFKSKLVRLIGSFFFIASTLMYTAIVLYAPATALNAVSGVKLELLILISGLACTFYTAVGGLKAVVWTDAFQALVMYAGLLAVVIQGMIQVGGVTEFWNRAYDGGRILTSFSPDPFEYQTFWSVVLGTAFGWMATYGISQSSVQRYTSLSSLRKAQCSLLLVLPGMFTLFPLVLIAGLVMYVYYADCDPLQLGLVKNRDQLIPHFTVEILGHVPGLPGIFLACLYSGTLSTVSSNLNSLSAVIWEDFLKPTPIGKRIKESQATTINKLTALTVLQLLGGPVAGVFLFGIIFPWADVWGALAGVIGSSAIMAWITIGAQIIKPYRKSLPRSIAGCSNATLYAAGLLTSTVSSSLYDSHDSTVSNFTAAAVDVHDDIDLSGYKYIYKLSYLLYSLVAILLVLVIGVPVSLITTKGQLDDENVPLVWSGVRFVMCCVSKRWRKIWEVQAKETSRPTDKVHPVVDVMGKGIIHKLPDTCSQVRGHVRERRPRICQYRMKLFMSWFGLCARLLYAYSPFRVRYQPAIELVREWRVLFPCRAALFQKVTMSVWATRALARIAWVTFSKKAGKHENSTHCSRTRSVGI